MNKHLKRLIVFCAGVLVLFGIYALTALLASAFQQLPEMPETAEIISSGRGFAPGEDVRVELKLPLPLIRTVQETGCVPGKGSVLAGEPQIRIGAWRFSRLTRTITLTLRGLVPGMIPEGSLSFAVSRIDQKEPHRFTVKIPGFEVLQQEKENSAVELAPESEVRKSFSKHYFWLLLIPAVIVLILLLKRKKERLPRELTAWERSKEELSVLQREISAREIAPETAAVRLCELLRRYLENRFGLPATRRTTGEFLEQAEYHTSALLPRESRPFLRNFLQFADMVKFARAQARWENLAAAADDLGRLIEQTRPETEEKKNV